MYLHTFIKHPLRHSATSSGIGVFQSSILCTNRQLTHALNINRVIRLIIILMEKVFILKNLFEMHVFLDSSLRHEWIHSWMKPEELFINGPAKQQTVLVCLLFSLSFQKQKAREGKGNKCWGKLLSMKRDENSRLSMR